MIFHRHQNLINLLRLHCRNEIEQSKKDKTAQKINSLETEVSEMEI